MSDLFGNHVVGFPTRRLIFHMLKLFFIMITLKTKFDDIFLMTGIKAEVFYQIQ